MSDPNVRGPTDTGRRPDEALESTSTTSATPAVGFDGEDASESRPQSPGETDSPISETGARATAPMQKRRRVTRACDECRRKKIKCDGKQPCTHCTVYSYECTYDQPSNRRRNPAPQYIEALEQRLHKAEAILRSVLPGLDLEDPKFDARSVEQLIEAGRATQAIHGSAKPGNDAQKCEDDAQIQSMVDRTGSLDLDDHGHWDFHGHSSGYVFVRKFRAQFGDQFLPATRLPNMNRTITKILESPRSASSSPFESNLLHHIDLPPKEVAIELCRNTLDDCCALMRPVHRPTFFKRLHSVYDTDPEQYKNHHVQFLPLLYLVMAVGCLFAKTENENTMLDLKGYKEAIEQGVQYFSTAKQLLDITDCRDVVTIQAIVFMILFLQSSSSLSTCYAYVGVALRACCRLGLHRSLPNKFNPIESEERKRIFWLVRKFDTYTGAVLGLPQMLSDEDIDQELPSEVEDDYITEEGILPMPPGTFAIIRATNAHTRLTQILRKVVQQIYPLKPPEALKGESKYSISHKKIRELERDLQNWMDQLPAELRPSDDTPRPLSRVQQHLRMNYAHVQMMLYRPFIHYVAQYSPAKNVDKRSFACAAACISVARNIVHITSEMKRRGLLVGAYWFVMYTTYFAILSLLFFVIENPDNPVGKDILKDAVEGRDTLASLAKRSMAADRCSVSLTGLFDVLPQKLKERRGSLHAPPTANRKRPSPSSERGSLQERQTFSETTNPPRSESRDGPGTPTRTRTLPSDYLANLAKRSSVPDPLAPSNYGEGVSGPTQSPLTRGFHSPSISSPMAAGFQFSPQPGKARFPDFKNPMFPSDNPFAYPNPPTSALESVDGQYSFSEASMAANEHSMFGPPSNGSGQIPTSAPQFDYDLALQQTLNGNGNPSLPQQFANQHRDFHVPFGDVLMQNTMGVDFGHLGGMASTQEPMHVGDIGQPPNQDEFWNGVNHGQMGMGGEGGQVTDDFFGPEGWNTTWVDHNYG